MHIHERIKNEMELDENKITYVTRSRQNKTHHKKRINKKWLKRYGITYYQVPDPFLTFAIVEKILDKYIPELMVEEFSKYADVKTIGC